MAAELASVARVQILQGEAGLHPSRADVSFDEAAARFEAWKRAEKCRSSVLGYALCLKALAKARSGKRLSLMTARLIKRYRKARTEAG